MLRLTLFAAALCTATGAFAFSQNSDVGMIKGAGSPPGHDHITIVAANELIEGKVAPSRPIKARLTALGAAEKKLVDRLKVPLARPDPYFPSAKRDFVLSAVYGQRWVDLTGTSVATQMDCFNGLAQDPDSLQHDHFLRERGETGLDGGQRAAERSAARFKSHFLAAAAAKPGRLTFIDGGLTTRKLTADRGWFLFGRALHLLQDSFSPEHAVRSKEDYRKVVGVKSFVCTQGSEQHTTNKPLTATYVIGDNDEDIIWKTIPSAVVAAAVVQGVAPGPSRVVARLARLDKSEKNVKPAALVAIEATKDLFAAFVRVLAKPEALRAKAASAEADALIAAWMTVDPPAMKARWQQAVGNVTAFSFVLSQGDQKICDKHIDKAKAVGRAQNDCLAALTEKGAEIDEVTRVPYVYRLAKRPAHAEDSIPASTGPKTKAQQAVEAAARPSTRRQPAPKLKAYGE